MPIPCRGPYKKHEEVSNRRRRQHNVTRRGRWGRKEGSEDGRRRDGNNSEPARHGASVAVHAGCPPEVVILGHSMQGSEPRHRNLVVVEVPPRHALHLLRIDGIDPENHLGAWDAAAICEHLLAYLFALRSTALRATEEGRFQLTLRPHDLLICDGMGEDVATEHELAHSVFHRHLVTSDIKTEHASVLVELGETLELICTPHIHLVGDIVNGTVS
mmetsp:Transcript_32827/g.69890  ORF Transcript_32827/g.69890 Transcript_32827/m.69890 type:complete len:216 (-) Transcript_32827:976-1623(-)